MNPQPILDSTAHLLERTLFNRIAVQTRRPASVEVLGGTPSRAKRSA
jgi:hypothetical protein